MTTKSSFSIKSWAEDDRPREKLIHKGKMALSDAELIAVLIGSGNKEESAVELAKRIMADSNNKLNELSRLSVSHLIKRYKGIGEAKAVAIVAAIELGRRRKGEVALYQNKMTSSKAVFEVLQPLIGDLNHEEFWVLYLNNSNKIIRKMQLSKGSMTGTLVDVRLVYKKALELGATFLIFAHNHPSGSLKPSTSDMRLTKKLKAAGESLDIKMLDHLIVTQSAYFSFADEGYL